MHSVGLLSFPVLWRALQWALFSCIIGYVSYRLWSLDVFFEEQVLCFTSTLSSNKGFLWWMVVFLCPLNWFFETMKWKVAISNLSTVRFVQALKGVLTGQALNLVMPASIGHYTGRLVQTENGTLKQVASVFVCQAMQMFITFFASLCGFAYLGRYVLPYREEHIFILIGIVVVVGIAAVFLRHLSFSWIQKIKEGFLQLTPSVIIEIGVYSLFRYLVFTFQFILMLYFLGAEGEWYVLASAITLVFMAKSLLPSLHFMTDLGIREFCALLFLPAVGLPESMVIAASLWIWLINILLPSLAGAFLLMEIKLNRTWL